MQLLGELFEADIFPSDQNDLSLMRFRGKADKQVA